MPHFPFNKLQFIVAIIFLYSCTSSKKIVQPHADFSSLKYLDSYEIPFNLKFKNTTVGGLSSIDYDAKNDVYYLISDDRSDKNPARFYTAKFFISQRKIDSLRFLDVTNLMQPNGEVYPNNVRDKFKTPDPEAMRYNAQKKYFVWSSEGERIVKANDTVLTDPSVITISPFGKYTDSFSLPDNFKMTTTEKGPRRNGVFEGMSFADNYKTLYVNVEEPLYDDGPRADIVDNNAYIRIIKYDVKGKKSVAQYAYKLEPVAYAAKPENDFKINGVPDMLSLGNNKLLVIERSFSTGRMPCTIRLFKADLSNATDVSSFALKNNRAFVAASKEKILNMDDLGIYTDNIEGVTFGPLLPNGHRTLLFVADNNFLIAEKAQVLLFEVIE